MNETNNMGSGANYDKYEVNSASDDGAGRTETTDMNGPEKGVDFGQVKYAKKGAADTLYCDPTRMTDNDKEAYERMKLAPTFNEDDSQGGKY